MPASLYVGMSVSRSGTLPAIASSSDCARAAFSPFHALYVAIHLSYLPTSSFLWLEKKEYVSGDTYHFSLGRPSASRAESWYLTPASPCAAHVPAISSMPLPMIVLHTIRVGLPLSESLAYLINPKEGGN